MKFFIIDLTSNFRWTRATWPKTWHHQCPWPDLIKSLGLALDVITDQSLHQMFISPSTSSMKFPAALSVDFKLTEKYCDRVDLLSTGILVDLCQLGLLWNTWNDLPGFFAVLAHERSKIDLGTGEGGLFAFSSSLLNLSAIIQSSSFSKIR